MDATQQVIETRLNDMLSTEAQPRMWGGAESYELQILTLLELRYLPSGGQANLSQFMQRYARFLAPRHPQLGARALSMITDHETIAHELRAFRVELARDAPAEEKHWTETVLCKVCGETAREGSHATDFGQGHDFVPKHLQTSSNAGSLESG